MPRRLREIERTMELNGEHFYHLTCKACYSEFAVQVNPSAPKMSEGSASTAAAKYCVYCAAPTLTITPIGQHIPPRSNWMDIAVERGMPATPLSEQLIRALYELWDPSPSGGDPEWFRDYLDIALAEEQPTDG